MLNEISKKVDSQQNISRRYRVILSSSNQLVEETQAIMTEFIYIALDNIFHFENVSQERIQQIQNGQEDVEIESLND